MEMIESKELDELVKAFISETQASKETALVFLEDKIDNNDTDENKWNREYEKTLHAPTYAFVLPNLFELPSDFRSFLEKDLIETSTLKRLENSGHLNWWCWNGSGQRLWPLSTTGDGNCLLHAASLGMWGIHDRQLMLRNVLHEMLTRQAFYLQGSRRHTLWRRWRWTESISNLQSGLVLSDEEWQREWDNVLYRSAATPRTITNSDDETTERSNGSDQVYESLEAIHVFALAHILKRPIIIVSDTVLRNAAGEELAPIPFGGIYLPLECPSTQCHRSPLVLCYDSAHFSALVTMRHTPNNALQPVIPITDRNRNLLPLNFCVDPGPDFTWWKDIEDNHIAARIELSEADKLSLICEYMDIIKIEVRRCSFRSTVTAGMAHNDDSKKSITTFCGDAFTSKDNSTRILSEIAQQIRRKLKIRRKKKNSWEGDVPVSVADLKCSNQVVAARLHSHAHEYMEHMVENYLCSARERFEQSKNTPSSTLNRQRARLSHSFSTSSLLITCINNHCQKTASQSTNFLCNDCYEYQKQLMASFGCSQPGHLRSLRSSLITNSRVAETRKNNGSSVKSNTMPSICVASMWFGDNDERDAAKSSSRDDPNNGSVSTAYSTAYQPNARQMLPASGPDAPSQQRYCQRVAAGTDGIVHTVAVHYIHAPSEDVTTKVSSIEGANGVTHYYVSQ